MPVVVLIGVHFNKNILIIILDKYPNYTNKVEQ